MGNQNNEKLNELLKPIYSLLSSCGNEMNNIIQNELSSNATDESLKKLSSFDEDKEKAYTSLLNFKKDFETLSKYFDGTYVIEDVKEEVKDTIEEEVDNNGSINETQVEETTVEIEKEESDEVVLPEIEENNEDKEEVKEEVVLPEIEENNEEKEVKKEEVVTPEPVETSTEEKEDSNVELPVIEDNQNEEVTSNYVFNKIDETSPKVISVNEDQFLKLKEIKDTNEALLNTKKILVKEDNSNLEKDLTDNGLLEESDESKNKKLEELSDKATELYKEGKVEEAQELMNEISEINASMKNNEGQLVA